MAIINDSSNADLDFQAVANDSGVSGRPVDVSLFPPKPAQNSAFGMTYMSDVRHVGLFKILAIRGSLYPEFISEWPKAIPYSQFSSSVDENSTFVYMYYQVNETTIAEITFNLNSGIWSSNPTYIRVDAAA